MDAMEQAKSSRKRGMKVTTMKVMRVKVVRGCTDEKKLQAMAAHGEFFRGTSQWALLSNNKIRQLQRTKNIKSYFQKDQPRIPLKLMEWRANLLEALLKKFDGDEEYTQMDVTMTDDESEKNSLNKHHLKVNNLSHNESNMFV